MRAYYDTEDAATKSFLETLDALSQQNITMDVPETLQSQPILEKLMQTRVRNFRAQPAAASPEAAATAPAEAAPTPAEAPVASEPAQGEQ